MAPWEYTIAELLSDAGYATAMYGKWHIGDKDGRLPNDQGYDEWYGTKESAMEASFSSTPQYDPSVYPIPHIWAGNKGEASKKVKPFDHTSRALLDREIVEKTAAFVKREAKAGKPFYVYAALTQIHPPFLPHPDFEGKSKAGAYADFQMEVDYNVGHILDAINEAGVANDTIVILTGDHAAGEATGERGSNGAIAKAQELAESGDYVMLFQYGNEANPLAHYEGTGREILDALGPVDAFVAGLGTGGTLMGVGRVLREANPDVKIVAAEPPIGELVAGLRSLDDGYIPPVFHPDEIDGKILVRTRDSVHMTRRLLHEEGLFAGPSSGAAAHAAVRWSEKMDRGTIVTLLPDAGWKYLSSGIWLGTLDEAVSRLGGQLYF